MMCATPTRSVPSQWAAKIAARPELLQPSGRHSAPDVPNTQTTLCNGNSLREPLHHPSPSMSAKSTTNAEATSAPNHKSGHNPHDKEPARQRTNYEWALKRQRQQCKSERNDDGHTPTHTCAAPYEPTTSTHTHTDSNTEACARCPLPHAKGGARTGPAYQAVVAVAADVPSACACPKSLVQHPAPNGRLRNLRKALACLPSRLEAHARDTTWARPVASVLSEAGRRCAT